MNEERASQNPSAERIPKNPPAKQETWAWSLDQEDPLEKETATHSSILAWEIPWEQELSRLQSVGWESVRHDIAAKQQHHRGVDRGRSLSYSLFPAASTPFLCMECKYMQYTCNTHAIQYNSSQSCIYLCRRSKLNFIIKLPISLGWLEPGVFTQTWPLLCCHCPHKEELLTQYIHLCFFSCLFP